MRVAVCGYGLSMAWLDEIDDIIIIEQLNQLSWKEVSEALDTFYPEFVEPTPYVGCYQSRNERSLIWASALQQLDWEKNAL